MCFSSVPEQQWSSIAQREKTDEALNTHTKLVSRMHIFMVVVFVLFF